MEMMISAIQIQIYHPFIKTLSFNSTALARDWNSKLCPQKVVQMMLRRYEHTLVRGGTSFQDLNGPICNVAKDQAKLEMFCI